MTKKNFIALARFIQRHHASCFNGGFTEKQINLLANFCQEQNSNFNYERWIDFINGKCGPNGGEVK